MLARGILGPLMLLAPRRFNHPEFLAQGFTYRVGARVRGLFLWAGYIVTGIGLLRRAAWSLTLALVLLAVATPYEANSCACGFSTGLPTRLTSYVIVIAWNGWVL